MTEREVLYRIKVVDDPNNDKILAGITKARERTDDKIRKSTEERLSKSSKQERESADDRIAQWEDYTQSRIKLLDRIAKLEQRDRMKRERSTKDETQALKRQLDQAQRDMSDARMRMLEGFEGLSEAVGRVGRGVAVLGLIGEENLQKFTDGLAKVVAGFELFTGSIRIVTRTITVMDALTKSTLAAAAAQEVLNVAQSRGAAAGAAGAGGAAGSSVMRALGAGGASAAGAGAATAAARGGIGAAIGAAGSKLASFAVTVAKFGGAALVAEEAFQGARRALGDTSDSAESFIGALLSWRDAAKASEKSTKDVEEAEKRLMASRAHSARQAERRQIALDQFAGRMAINRERGGRNLFGTTGQERLGELGERQALLRLQRQRLLERTSGGTDEDLAVRREQMEAIIQAQMDATREEFQIRQQMNEERRAVIREGIDGAKQEMATVKQQIAAERAQLLSAKERFGQLDPREQARLIQLKRRAETQGTGALSTRDLQDLQSVGTGRASELARQEFRRRADAAGFGGAFGQQERAAIQAGQQQVRQLRAEITDRRQLEVKLDTNDDRLVEQFRTILDRLLDEREEVLIRRMQRVADERMNALVQQSDQQLAQRAGVLGP